MLRFTRRASFTFFAVFGLLCGLPEPGYADYLLENVSKERAKQLGIAVITRERTDDVLVQVEFKTAGALKEFRWADLELTRDGKRLVTAALLPQKLAGDRIQLQFYVEPAALANATVTVFVADQALGGSGYRLRMK